MTQAEYNQIQQVLLEKKIATKEEILELILNINPDRNPSFLRFYLFDLMKNNVVYKLNKTHYKASGKLKPFSYEYTESDLKLKEKIEDKFQGIDICIWNTSFLSQYLNLLPSVYYTFIEINQEFQEYLYNYLKNDYNVLFDPNKKELDLYSKGSNRLIIKKLVQRAPLDRPYKHNIAVNKNMKKESVSVYKPTIEKILVDIFVESKNYDVFNDRDEIFVDILKSYCINFQKLFAYAKYRGVLKELEVYLLNEMNYDFKRGEFK